MGKANGYSEEQSPSYIPPDRISCVEILDSLNESVCLITERMNPSDQLLLLGDFNTPSLSWLPSPTLPLHFTSTSTSTVYSVRSIFKLISGA